MNSIACRNTSPTLIIVAAYGLLLPQPILDIPTLGVHQHPCVSACPRWRGASPITFAILSGDAETGVTLMQIDQGLDTGTSSPRVPFRLHPTIRRARSPKNCPYLGAQLLLETLPAYLDGKFTPTPQDHLRLP